MLESSLIIPSSSEFGSPLRMVPKPNSIELLLVGDYKILNKMFSQVKLLHRSQINSTIDLKSAFHHVPAAPEDLYETTIRTPIGAFA